MDNTCGSSVGVFGGGGFKVAILARPEEGCVLTCRWCSVVERLNSVVLVSLVSKAIIYIGFGCEWGDCWVCIVGIVHFSVARSNTVVALEDPSIDGGVEGVPVRSNGEAYLVDVLR